VDNQRKCLLSSKHYTDRGKSCQGPVLLGLFSITLGIFYYYVYSNEMTSIANKEIRHLNRRQVLIARKMRALNVDDMYDFCGSDLYASFYFFRTPRIVGIEYELCNMLTKNVRSGYLYLPRYKIRTYGKYI